ncbi:hypothetical protein A0H81_06383 [Grifola frondosa]|uniref:PLP-dependent transferase n=1 Tax=Grifola frondosa TaxID=5627 RepID=A0A1C7MBQ6_GRIFR|nr:hypothetical protein A0H81_06383 [Grifola frondosa]
MTPAPTTTPSDASTKPALKPTAILHRTPWRPPVATAAEGMYVWLEDGRKVLDAVGGAAVEKVSYVYNMQLSNEPAEELARVLIASSKGAFELCGFVSGGSEAMEGVMKLARQYYYETGQPQRSNFIGRKLSFHGNTLGTLSLAYHPTRRAPYAAILDDRNFHHVSPAYAKRFQKPGETEEQYVERLRQELEDKFLELGSDTVIGFVAETVVRDHRRRGATQGLFQAMNKFVMVHFGFASQLDRQDWALYMHGRHSGRGHPDIQAVAKGLGGGYASIGAILMSKKVADGVRDSAGFWKHGHTYQAHPLACAASLAVQKVIVDEKLLENVNVQGPYLESLLRARLQAPNALAAPFTFDIRGRGAWWGIEFDFTGPEAARLDFKGTQFAIAVQARCLQNGLIVMGLTSGANLEGTRGDHCMLSPAYNVTKEQVEAIVDIFVASVEEILKEAAV